MFLARKLKKWSENKLISAEQANNILAFEKDSGRSRIFFGLGGLGVLSIILGIGSLIAANWDLFSPTAKIVNHTILNVVVAGLILKFFSKPSWIREVMISLQAGLVMTFIALIGQVLQTQAPLWQPLGFWLLFVTPMLLIYARFFGIIAVWLGLLGVFSISFAEHVLTKEQSEVFLAALPFVPFILFSLSKVKAVLPNWTTSIQNVFWVLVVATATFLQILWHEDTTGPTYWVHIPPMASVLTAGAGTLIVFLLNVAQRNRLISFWEASEREWDALLIVSFFIGAAPILILHTQMAFVGALIFCLYWLFIGGMGLRLGIDRLWSLAMFLIGMRIFIAYVEIMGSLAIQGIGFIVSGAIFLALAWGTRKIIQSKPRWLLVQKSEGV